MSSVLKAELIGQQLSAAWGRDGLRPIPAQEKMGLSEPAQRLLAAYGLPKFWGGPLGCDAASLLLEGHSFLAGFAVSRQQGGAVVVSEYPEMIVNTDLARFAACLVLHRTLLEEGAALARRFDTGNALMPGPFQTEYRAAMDILMDHIEREMREADPAVWQGVMGAHADYYGGETELSYWPAMLGEYDWYAMWDAEDVYARWAGVS